MTMMVELFYVTSRIVNLSGYKNVPMCWFVAERARPLFGPDGWFGIPYARVIIDYDETSEYRHYCEGAVEELFTADEARVFVEFIRTHRNDLTAVIEPVTLPIKSNRMGVGWQAVGGETDFLSIGDSEDYDLPFKVRGFFSVAGCEFDETLPGAERMRRGVFIHPDGDVEPWLVDDLPKLN